MASTKKIVWVIGIATGALLTLGAISTKGGKKTKEFIQEKFKKTFNSQRDFTDHDNYYV